MPRPNHPNEHPEARLRVDPAKVAEARIVLAEIDATVFAGSARHPADEHAVLIGRAVAALFAHD